jgi:outer membrane protein assembly factor BamE (lipoprotein component of BamABCDE complex)
MKSAHHIVAITAIAALSACSTVMTTAQSGYLSDYSALDVAPDAASVSRVAAQAIDPAQVSCVTPGTTTTPRTARR